MADSQTRTLPAAAPAAGSTASADTAVGPVAPAPARLPEIPRYTIVRQIGRGGMGVVYEAIGPLGVRVALKIIHPGKLTPTLLARFRQEARAMMELDHPHLARIYDYGEYADEPYLTMKLLSGRTLADLLPELWRDPRAAVRLAAQVAGAVGFVHARQKVHRDLKPTNVLLGDRGEPYVSDFGLIKDVTSPDSDVGPPGAPGSGATTPRRGHSTTLTQTGARLGTEAYMPPEQLAGDLARIGPPTDVYALGVILHEMLWNARPQFDSAGLVAYPDPPTDDEPAEASVFRSRVFPIVVRCLAFEPQDRYPNAEALRQELEALLDAPAESPPAPTPTRRRFLVAAGVGVLGLTGAGVAAIRWAVNSRRKDPPDPLEEIQRELADKGSVDLLLPDGRWRWHEWVAGEAEWTAGPEGGGFDAPRGRTRLLEVARGLSDSGFRLTVRFRQARPGAEVGVYVGRSQQPSSRGPSHCLVALVADDYRPPPGPGGQPYVARWVLARSAPADGNGEFWDAPPIDRPPPASGRPGDWIDAVLTLTADRLSVQADGREFRRRSRSQLLPSAQQLGFARTGFEGLTPTFHPTEGVGLFATNSRIEVSTARLDRPDRD